jgi:hypothetical protein
MSEDEMLFRLRMDDYDAVLEIASVEHKQIPDVVNELIAEALDSRSALPRLNTQLEGLIDRVERLLVRSRRAHHVSAN